MKCCVVCKITKQESDFYTYEFIKNVGRCKECLRRKSKDYAKNNPEKKKAADKKYQENNKEYIRKQKRGYVKLNKEKIKERQANWYYQNRDDILEKSKEYRQNNKKQRNDNERKRRQNDPVYKLRTNVSKVISQKLKNMQSQKDGGVMKYLPYSFQELKLHLEKQFKPWMNWDNYGKYIKSSWNDNDPSTWTWQLDHIIPQIDLPYISMEDYNFKKCWSLDNLRPLSAKINNMLGVKLSSPQSRKKRAQ